MTARASGGPALVPADTAAWIRAHAWTPAVRDAHQRDPNFGQACTCPPRAWYIDQPGNVVHHRACTHRNGATRWRPADGLTYSQALNLATLRGLCPAPCMRRLDCAAAGFNPTTGQLDIYGGTT